MSKINKIKVENTTYDIQDNTSGFITKDVNDLTNYELKTATGNSIEMSIDSSTYVMTLSLKNSQGTILNTQTVDLPLETMVVGGTYDSTNKKIILTLKNGNTIDVPVGDLINGLQSEITSTNKLDASLVDDSLSNNKFVTTSEKTTWNNKADTSDIPTKTSDLVNDSDFTSQEVYNVSETSNNEPFVFDGKKRGLYIVYEQTNALQNPTKAKFYYKLSNNTNILQLSARILYFYLYEDINYDNFNFNKSYGKIIYLLRDSTNICKAEIFFDETYKELNLSNGFVNFVNYVDTIYSQNISGVKTFYSIPKQSNTTAPTQDTEFTNKKYVDDSIASAITTTLNGSY